MPALIEYLRLTTMEFRNPSRPECKETWSIGAKRKETRDRHGFMVRSNTFNAQWWPFSCLFLLFRQFLEYKWQKEGSERGGNSRDPFYSFLQIKRAFVIMNPPKWIYRNKEEGMYESCWFYSRQSTMLSRYLQNHVSTVLPKMYLCISNIFYIFHHIMN